MMSMTTKMEPPAKKQRCSLKPSTIEALEEERAEPIEIGILVLPAGFESACGIMTNILLYLDIRSLCNVKRSSLIQQCRKAFGSDDFERVRDVALSLSYEGRRSINEIVPSLKYTLILFWQLWILSDFGRDDGLRKTINFHHDDDEKLKLAIIINY